MQLKLSVGKIPMSGRLNIDPCPQIEADKISQFKISPLDFRVSLDSTVKNASCTNIICDDVINYVIHEQLANFLQIVTSKLRKNGVITITGTDCFEVCRAFMNGEIDIATYNTLVFGSGNHPWAYSSGISSIVQIEGILKELGITIISLSLEKHKYVISGVR